MHMSIKLLVSVFFACIVTPPVLAKDLCLGTFSNLQVNPEAGDLLGTEIHIVGTHAGKQASVQFAEGEAGKLIVATIVCDGSHVSFKLPPDNGRAAATFNGQLSATRLTGEFVFDSGARDKVILVRRKSYWD